MFFFFTKSSIVNHKCVNIFSSASVDLYGFTTLQMRYSCNGYQLYVFYERTVDCKNLWRYSNFNHCNGHFRTMFTDLANGHNQTRGMQIGFEIEFQLNRKWTNNMWTIVSNQFSIEMANWHCVHSGFDRLFCEYKFFGSTSTSGGWNANGYRCIGNSRCIVPYGNLFQC